MEKLTKEEFEYLQKFETQINTATKSDYMRGIQKADVEKIGKIYSRLIGQTYTFNSSCSRCILKLIKLISSYYYDGREDWKKRKAEEEETQRKQDRYGNETQGNPEEVGQGERPKGNRGRPKKGLRS